MCLKEVVMDTEAKSIKKKIKQSRLEYKAYLKRENKKATESFPYYPSMFGPKSKKPSAKGRVLVFDSENRGLLPDLHYGRLSDGHVIHVKDKETGEHFQFFDPYEFRRKKDRVWLESEGEQDGFYWDGIKFLNEADVIISQNWLGYDSLALEKISPGTLKVDFEAKPRGGKKRREEYPFRVMDTMVMSQLLNPERKPPRQAYAMDAGNVGPHSIEAHGYRMGLPKPVQEQWDYLEDSTLNRCKVDVDIGDDFYDFLMEEWYEQSEPHNVTGLTIADAYRLEAFICHEIAKQEQRGFRLDLYHAHNLVNKIDEEIETILAEAMPNMPLLIDKVKLNHTTLRASTEKAGYEYLLDKKQKIIKGYKPLGFKAKDINNALKKSWKKAGGKEKEYIERTRQVVTEKEVVTHGSKRSTNWNFITKTGNYNAYSKKDFPEYATGNISDHKDPVLAGPYTPIVWKEITLGNRNIVRQTLYLLGWRGVNLTDGEQKHFDKTGEIPYYYAGKLDEDSIKAWELNASKDGYEVPKWAKDILRYYVLSHRRSQILNKKDVEYFEKTGELPRQPNGKREIRGLVPRARDVATGKEFQDYIISFGIKYWNKKQWTSDDEFRVPAAAFAIGTNTFRMRHKYVVNIPSRGIYGKEMRQLFIASEGKLILGCDGAGLELRMLSHFMNDPDYEKVLLEGDIHTHNQEKAGLPERDMAKTFIYAFLYGSGILNLALVCGMTEDQMVEKVYQFLEELPLLKELIEGVKEAAVERGYLRCLDGRLGRVRKSQGKVKEHTALNVLLQMTGSVCMKWGLYFAVKEFRKHNIEPELVCNMHDEVQMEIPKTEVEYKEYKIKSFDWKEEEKKVDIHESGGYWSAPDIIKGNPKEDKKITVRRSYHLAGHLLCKSFEKAGEYLCIRTPLAGEYKIGESWAKTH